MSEPSKTCVVINKQGATLRPSESFIRAHVERLPGRVLPVVGTPGLRRTGLDSGRYLLSQSGLARGSRWARRSAGLATLEQQDCRSLVRFFREQGVAVVLAEYGPTAVTILPACEIAGVPLVTHFHGWDAYVLAGAPAQAESYRKVFEKSEALIAVSRHMKAHLVSLGAPPDKIVWNPCGTDIGESPAQPDKAPPTFLTVGRPAPKKAVIVSLLAFARVHAEIPDARFELIGVDEDTHLLQAARALRIERAISFLGPMPHHEVLERMRAARCYLHPSVTALDGDMEGTPVSVLEAMAAGLPVVATRHGGIMDVLDGTSAGMLVNEFDVEATSEAMLVYGSDPERAASDGMQGRQLVEAYWAQDLSIQRLSSIIEAARTRDRSAIARLAARAIGPETNHAPEQ